MCVMKALLAQSRLFGKLEQCDRALSNLTCDEMQAKLPESDRQKLSNARNLIISVLGNLEDTIDSTKANTVIHYKRS